MKNEIIVFVGGFCGPSNLALGWLDEAKERHGHAASFEIVDVEKDPATTRNFEVKGTPTFLHVRDGQPAASLIGTTNKDALLVWLGERLG